MIRSYDIDNYKSGRTSRTYEVVNKITEYLESQLLEGINEGFFMKTARDFDNCYKKDFDNKNRTIFIDSQSKRADEKKRKQIFSTASVYLVYTDANGVIYNIKRSSDLSTEEEIKLFGREDLAGELKEMFIGKELILEPSGAGTTKYICEAEKPTYVEGSFAAILAGHCEPPAHLKEWLESSF